MQMGRAEFCRRYGWTPEKYRKVAQRARTRLGSCSRTRTVMSRFRESVGTDNRDRPMILPPLIGRAPGTPAVGYTDGSTAILIRAQAAGNRMAPRSGFRPPA